ncbi:MAG: Uma2 family endonuclease [Gloeomargaritaceae cyanobacterium C42_A2020_066]|nr:Uma2 family endonuclease [Gloeomargaritaceae cyanobacterium C42_A2020_066]
MIALNLSPALPLTDEAFGQLCRSNPDLRLERTAQGKLVAMAPTGGETGLFNTELLGQLWLWNRQTRLGFVFDSSTGFRLPNGAIRTPDLAWVEKTRWQRLSVDQRRRFVPLCPDFVVELKSPSDDLPMLQAKLQEYQDNGAQLGWLIVPETRQVFSYQPGRPVTVLEAPVVLSGSPLLPNFVMDCTGLWS